MNKKMRINADTVADAQGEKTRVNLAKLREFIRKCHTLNNVNQTVPKSTKSGVLISAGPSPKRLSATSPLGKKGCECTYCGKILHNQGESLMFLQRMADWRALFFFHTIYGICVSFFKLV